MKTECNHHWEFKAPTNQNIERTCSICGQQQVAVFVDKEAK